MSASIDERIVQMQFDNRQFEEGAKESIGTIEKLKRSLNFKGASDSLRNFESSTRGLSFSGLSSAIDSINNRFSTMGIIATTAIQNITNRAVNAGVALSKALTLDPIGSGLSEYETQINAIQTILANTESKGTDLQDVNDALDELNRYADKTIYNFTEMTRNIGTFTAAGVDLETSTSSIKGIANLAAVSGSTSAQASNAMYQLSQAIASGTVKLMDWNSVVNAGMGGELFQNALKRTARIHNVQIDEMIEKEGSFRETLSKGWLTSDILTETLATFTGDLSELDLKIMGYTDEEAQEIMKLGQTASDAATKVKTFTQLISTLKEALQSGWTQSWEYVIGDFEEAKKLWTGVSDALGSIIQQSSDSRNAILEGWKNLGGRTHMIEAFKNVFEGLGSIFSGVSESFRSIFPPKTSQDLVLASFRIQQLTKSFKDFFSERVLDPETWEKTAEGYRNVVTGEIVPLETTFEKIKNIFTGFFSSIKILRTFLGSAWKYISKIISPMGSYFTKFISYLSDFSKNVTYFSNSLENNNIFDSFFQSISNKFTEASEFIKNTPFIKTLNDFISKVKATLNFSIKDDEHNGLSTDDGSFFGRIISALKWFTEGIQVFENPFATAASFIRNTLTKLWEALKILVPNLENVNLFDIFKTLFKINLGFKIYSLIKSWKGVPEGLTDIFENVSDVFKNFKTGSSGSFIGKLSSVSKSVLMISIGIAAFGHALKTIGSLDANQLLKGALALGALLGAIAILSKVTNNTGEVLSKFGDSIKAIGTGIAFVAIAGALLIFVQALKSLSSLDTDLITKGILSIGAILIEVAAFTKLASGIKFRTLLGIVPLALSLQLFIMAMKSVTKMDPDEIKEGLLSIGAILAELAIFTRAASGIKFRTLLGVIPLALSLQLFIMAMKSVAKMEPDEIKKSLLSIGAILIEIAAFTKLSSGIKLSALIGMVPLAIAIKAFSSSLEDISKLDEKSIIKGVLGIGAILAEISIFTRVASGIKATTIVGVIPLAISIAAFANSIKTIGSLDTVNILKGVTAIGAILAEIGAFSKLAHGISLKGVAASLALSIFISKIADSFENVKDVNPLTMVSFAGSVSAMMLSMSYAIKVMSGISLTGVAKGVAALDLAIVGISAILGIVAGFIGSAAISISGSMVQVGSNLKLYSDIVSDVDSSNVDNSISSLKNLALTMAEIGLLNTGSFDSFSSKIVPLGSKLKLYSSLTDGIDPKGNGLLIAQDIKNVIETITGISIGDYSLDSLSNDIARLGGGLVLYADSVSKVSSVDIGENGNVGSILSQLIDTIPNNEGLSRIQSFASEIGNGENMLSYGTALSALGTAIKSYSDSVKGIDSDSVTFSTNTMSVLNNLQNNLPTDGGIFSRLSGKRQTLTDFGIDLVALGSALYSYSESVSGIDNEKITASTNSMTLLNDLQTNLPNVGGLLSIFTGNKDLATFGTKLSTFGAGVKTYAESVKDITSDEISNVMAPIDLLAQIQGRLGETGGVAQFFTGTQDISTFGENLEDFGMDIGKFADSLKNVTVPNNIDDILNMIDTISNIEVKLRNIEGFGDSITDLDLTSFAEEITSFFDILSYPDDYTNLISIKDYIQSIISKFSEYNTNFEASGLNAGISYSNGIISSGPRVRNSLVTVLGSALSVSNSFRGNFVSSGSSLMSGLANGIYSNASAPINAARSVANRVLSSTNAALDIHSPSKKYEDIGMYSDLGWANGLIKYMSVVNSASEKVGNSAYNLMTLAMSQITNAIENESTFSPTIRPVMDLSGIRNDNKVIDGILKPTRFDDMDTYLSKRTLDGIQQGFNRRTGQNGSDLATAVSQLSTRVDDLTYAISNMRVVTETGVIVGQIKTELNREFGKMLSREGRKN